jgi:hypothetical protein
MAGLILLTGCGATKLTPTAGADSAAVEKGVVGPKGPKEDPAPAAKLQGLYRYKSKSLTFLLEISAESPGTIALPYNLRKAVVTSDCAAHGTMQEKNGKHEFRDDFISTFVPPCKSTLKAIELLRGTSRYQVDSNGLYLRGGISGADSAPIFLQRVYPTVTHSN